MGLRRELMATLTVAGIGDELSCAARWDEVSPDLVSHFEPLVVRWTPVRVSW